MIYTDKFNLNTYFVLIKKHNYTKHIEFKNNQIEFIKRIYNNKIIYYYKDFKIIAYDNYIFRINYKYENNTIIKNKIFIWSSNILTKKPNCYRYNYNKYILLNICGHISGHISGHI